LGEFKSGYVSIVGETNAGKSTLLNGLMGEKLAIVSPKVQTTRNNIKGIYTDKNKQIIFIDTPGIHKVNSKLSGVMIDSAITSIKDANIVLFVVAGNKKSLSVFDYNVLKKLKEAKEKNKNLHIIGIINKIDRIKKELIIEKIKELNDELEFDYIISVSAMLREGISDILKRIEELLPNGPKYYSEDEYTDQTVREMCEEIIRGKALKLLNQEIPHGLYVEIEGFKHAMVRDGIAMVKFLRWLKPAVKAGKETEISLEKKLTSLRAEQDLFRGISFDTIVGYEEHGAIVHYEATPQTDIPVKPHGFVLIDSGAQYQDGTTDITRTIALGDITEEQRHIYTLVLKGHIQLALCKFPNAACGSQIDAFARQAMWREGYNFMHGTGHGVGSFLNVHEGPHQIRMEWRPAPLHAGMTVTDEPGIYLAGKFGVRIENTLYIKPYKKTDFGTFLQFESLTLAPIDTAPIDFDLLTAEEIEWLNRYHARVYETLSPHLNEEERAWLAENTAAVKL